MNDSSAEPSMEEILSSIKRIIAEEEAPTGRRRAGARAAAPEPTDADDQREDEVPEPGEPMTTSITPSSLPRFGRNADDAAPSTLPAPEPTESAPVVTDISPDREPEPHPVMPSEQPADPAPESIVSPAAAEATRGALASLSKLATRPDAPDAAGDGPLEQVVREMLRPMLRDWLDQHLPDMVEAMVSKEIARISGQGR